MFRYKHRIAGEERDREIRTRDAEKAEGKRIPGVRTQRPLGVEGNKGRGEAKRVGRGKRTKLKFAWKKKKCHHET